MGENQKIKQLKDIKGAELPLDTNAAWLGIEGALNKADNRRKLLWWYSAASVALILSIIGFSKYFLSNHNQLAQPTETIKIEDSKDVKEAQNATSDQFKNEQSNQPETNKVQPQSIIGNSGFKKQPNASKSNTEQQTNQTNEAELFGNLAIRNLAGFDWYAPQMELFKLPLSKEVKRIIDVPKSNKLSFEVFASATPSIMNKIVKSDNQLGWLVNKNFNAIAGKSEFATAGIQANLGFQINLTPKWFIQSGLGYSEKREWVKYNHTVTDFTTVRESEKDLLYKPLSPIQWININYEGNNSYKFIEIPVLIGTTRQLSSKWDWKIRGGVSYWRLIDRTGEKLDPTYLLLNDLSTLKYYRNNNLGIQLNSGLYYKLNSNWSIMAEPGGSLALSNLTKGSPVTTKPYNYGLNFGVQYKLK